MNLFGYELKKKEDTTGAFGKPIFTLVFYEGGAALSGPNGKGIATADPRAIMLAASLKERFCCDWVGIVAAFPTPESIKKWETRAIEYTSKSCPDPYDRALHDILGKKENPDNREVG